jgi:hypothetical protein
MRAKPNEDAASHKVDNLERIPIQETIGKVRREIRLSIGGTIGGPRGL